MAINFNNPSRRKFLKNTGLAATGIMIVPRSVLGGKGYTAPSDKVNIAGIGVGGRGESILKGAYANGQNNIVALCDVDQKRAEGAFKKWPKAPRYSDFEELLDKEAKNIDAVMIATPDNTHAVIALPCMALGKHVYVEKPLTHDVHEARVLTEAAQKYRVITQMGNQGSSGEGVRLMMEWMDAGIIGDVKEVKTWTNRPIWPQGIPTPKGKHEIPENLNWDLWQGPAKVKDYNPAYLPFKWRGWWDYGTGALGDMACHIMDPVFKSLKLTYPTEIEASVSQVYVEDFQVGHFPDSCPPASVVHYKFPAREGMPAVEVSWSDGGILPKRPDELNSDEALGDAAGGCLFIGTKGKILCGCYGANPTLLPTSSMKYFKQPEQVYRRVDEGHQLNWTNAIINNDPKFCSSSFDYAGPFTEALLLGNLAIRSYNLRELKKGKKETDWAPWEHKGRTTLHWDAEKLKITNFDPANQYIKREYRDGWSLKV
jgi:predicted dehydrogenase